MYNMFITNTAKAIQRVEGHIRTVTEIRQKIVERISYEGIYHTADYIQELRTQNMLLSEKLNRVKVCNEGLNKSLKDIQLQNEILKNSSIQHDLKLSSLEQQIIQISQQLLDAKKDL